LSKTVQSSIFRSEVYIWNSTNVHVIVIMVNDKQVIASDVAAPLFWLARLAPLREPKSTVVGVTVDTGRKATAIVGLGVGGDGTVVALAVGDGEAGSEIGSEVGSAVSSGVGCPVPAATVGGCATGRLVGDLVGDTGDAVGETGASEGFAEGALGADVGAVIVESQQSKKRPSEPGQQSPSRSAQSGCAEQLAGSKAVGAAVYPGRVKSTNEKSKVTPSSQVKARS
jgi:hypothetical protein